MFYKRLAKLTCLVGLACTQTARAFALQPAAPDTLRVDIRQAEKIFLDSNLQLLAQYYNIQSAEALVEQARKWDNPMLVTDQNVYANGRFFQHTTDAYDNPQGQVFVQVQQLIRTAGKRGKQIDLQKANVAIADWQFKTVMRELRATLIKDFYTIVQLQGNAALYAGNMQQLIKLRTGLEAELKAGNIAQKEYLRVQALIVSLDHDIVGNAKGISDAQAEIKTLLALTGDTFVQPVASEAGNSRLPSVAVSELVDTARIYNTDYKQEVARVQYDKTNVRLQRSLAVPDLTISPSYDQNSNYTPHYYGLGISLPLPVFDRNQGNIKSANRLLKAEEVLLKQADDKLQNDILNAYSKVVMTARLSSADNSTFYKDYNQLQKNIVESYNKRQISLLEFLQYFNDYKDVRKQQLEQELNFRLVKQELNDLVGKDILPL
jgi:cobalt-zinc-cadmium efflux system outer membrane protein